jgi:hypothetical protein
LFLPSVDCFLLSDTLGDESAESGVNEADSPPGIAGDPFESIPEIDGPVRIGFYPFGNGYA